jgi:glycosyltransferase involved in cell wall biosynthesis
MTADAVGGVWSYAITLAEVLATLPAPFRAHVFLAVMGPRPTAAQRARAAVVPNLRVFESDFQLEWMPNGACDRGDAAAWLRELAIECSPDIVHLNGYALAAEDWSVPVIVVGHSCVVSWWRAVHGTAPPAEWDDYRQHVALGLARADRVIAPSRAMLRALAFHYGLPRGGRVIANGCARERFLPVPKEDFVLAAGRLWDGGKNLAALDCAAARLPCPVYVAGDTKHPAGDSVKSRAVRVLGMMAPETLAHWMARAAIYALPARYEPFGLSVLEAAASGCALVLGDIPSLRESWHGAAVFVPPENPDALAEAIAALLADRQRRSWLANAARQRSEEFSATRMALSYAQLYCELIESHHHPHPRPLASAV